MNAWSGSSVVRVREVAVDRLPLCEEHPTVSRHVAGDLSITWEPSETGAGHLYSCAECADGPFGRVASALDDRVPGTQVTVEVLVLAAPTQIARAA
ncbi:hypothetical protein KALB_4847 [Kutzneria albida DSM 43870]|uniref:Uncharacterized protein n=1 Tax=Kutzneria albida DSM 43870 TaxID=1449976 RepID=W5WJ72_9PSEU|nr:hypothetical protein KALB_4847 [Kutzneria albida DSM 43870]